MHFDPPARETTLLEYVQEVEHMAERIQRLENAIPQAIHKAPPAMRAGDPSVAGFARRSATHGGDRARTKPAIPSWMEKAVGIAAAGRRCATNE